MNAVLGILIVIGLMFFVIIATTLVGGVVGWTVGLVFPFVIESLNQILNLSLTPFELGATIGFFGSFFRASFRQSK